MVKKTNLYAKLEQGLKEQVESILAQLDIPVSNTDLTEAGLNAKLEKGYADFVQGNVKSASETFSDIRRDYGI
ncbi:MAG: type II toxin-antitoxin system antitoxin, RelB/DinJ family [Peptococcaceae bacterium]|nr:type II toxin-antitoxin system antitoxin, RelB/DinJ family [Peptococcaceae bacterium]